MHAVAANNCLVVVHEQQNKVENSVMHLKITANKQTRYVTRYLRHKHETPQAIHMHDMLSSSIQINDFNNLEVPELRHPLQCL